MAGDVPAAVRALVVERDNSQCRCCGRWVEHPALHHVVFRSQGGLHVPGNLVVVGWYGDHDCHLRYAHGAMAPLFRELLLGVIDVPGVTAFQWRRWQGL